MMIALKLRRGGRKQLGMLDVPLRPLSQNFVNQFLWNFLINYFTFLKALYSFVNVFDDEWKLTLDVKRKWPVPFSFMYMQEVHWRQL